MNHNFDKKFYPYEHEEYTVRKDWEYVVVALIFIVLTFLAIIL